MTTNVFITSFHELVHHMTADRGVVLIILLTVVGTAARALIAAAPYFELAARHKKLDKQGLIQYRSDATQADRLGKQLLAKHFGDLPNFLLYSISAAAALDYLILVIMNSMGW